MLKTRLTERFGLLHPVLNAPMALIAGGELAAAVTRAGGLGLLGGGYAGTLGGEPPLAAEFARADGQRIGIGFITWALARVPALLAQALALQPACLFLSFADPARFAPSIHAAGIPLICQAQTLQHVREAIAAGADVIVAQGTEAGGHGGARATMPFVPEAADYLARHAPDTLLLAAGGIADGRGLAAALMLGADGVVVGTRFWAANEALTADPAVARAVAATGDHTIRTKAIDALRGVPWPADFSFRVMRNKLTDAWGSREAEAARAIGSLRDEYQAARLRSDLDVVPAVAGEAIGLLHARESAATLLTRMVSEAAGLLTRPQPLDWRH
jgi:nitronate monooxygenase